MILLAIDTTGANCSVALRIPGRDDVCETDVIGRGHAEHLAPMVARILDQANISPGDIDRLAVTTGPGSFAGTRVGIAFVRGLALSTQAEMVGLNTLDVLSGQIPGDAPIIAVHDAKRGDVVLKISSHHHTIEPTLFSLAEAESHILEFAKAGVLIGSGAELIDQEGVTDSQIRELNMKVFLDMAQIIAPDTSPAAPFYARPPDAKLPGGLTP